MVIVAFAVAAGMVLLVMLAMSASPADGAVAKVQPATPLTHTTASIHLRNDMRELWEEEHIAWTRLLIVSADRNLPDLMATTHRLLQHTKFASGM